MKKLLIMAILPIAAACGANHQTNQTAGTPAEQLAARLDTLSARGLTAFGHDDDPVYGHSWVGDTGRSDVMETAGDYPAVMNWDLGGIEKNDAANLDSVDFGRIRAEVIAQDARGGINAFSWHSVNPVDGGDSWQCSDTTIVSRIINDPEINGRFREQVRRAARFIGSLTDAGGSRIPVVFRPWHEHTGNWFWWGSDQCSADDYRALWHLTREVMDGEGIDNVVWAYSPDRVKDYDEYMERYPGDEYVDIMGADVYHWGGEASLDVYRKAAAATLGAATRAARERDKTVAFTETGLEGVTMPRWWTEVLLPIVSEYPVAYVVVWRNAHDKPGHFFAPWRGHDSADDFRKFHADGRTVFAKEMNKIR